MDTSGFYKLDGRLLYGPNFVLSTRYKLHKETKDIYTYPVDGWHWFDYEEQARQYFNLPTQPEEPMTTENNTLPELFNAFKR
jgi:hypothetical protein